MEFSICVIKVSGRIGVFFLLVMTTGLGMRRCDGVVE